MSRSVGLIEDDETIRRHVAKRLSKSYDVRCFETADAAWSSFESDPMDLYIVDRMVPGCLSGTQLCERMRAVAPFVPILILSALSEAGDRIDGLKAGADDYLTKPFEMEELCLRVEALFKRSLRADGAVTSSVVTDAPNASVHRVRFEDRVVDFDRYEATVGDKTVALPQKECQLLKLLVERRGRVVTRDEILDELWGSRLFPSVRTVDNFIVRLRRLLESDPGQPKYIQSVRGMGYKFSTHEAILD